MKIYNRKGFLWGIFWIALSIFSLVRAVIAPYDFLPQQIKHVVIAVLMLAIAMTGFFRAFSKQATKEDIIEKQDERNKLIKLQAKAKTSDILFWLLIVMMVGGLIGYILTQNLAWGVLFLIPALLVSCYWITYLILSVYYEHK